MNDTKWDTSASLAYPDRRPYDSISLKGDILPPLGSLVFNREKRTHHLVLAHHFDRYKGTNVEVRTCKERYAEDFQRGTMQLNEEQEGPSWFYNRDTTDEPETDPGTTIWLYNADLFDRLGYTAPYKFVKPQVASSELK